MLLVTVCILPQICLNGLVASDLWAWFVAPALGVRELPWNFMSGAMLLLTFLRGVRKLDAEPASNVVIRSLAFSLITWGIGWILWRIS